MKTSHSRMKHFEEVIQESFIDLRRFIYSLARKDMDTTEEIFQNTMEACVKNLHTLRDESKLRSWIFTIAKNEATRYYSKKKPVTFVELTEDAELLFTEEAARDTDFSIDVENKDFVKKLLTSLDSIHQQIFVLHYYYGLPLPEIAEILNMNLNTVRSIHLRDLHKMRKLANNRK